MGRKRTVSEVSNNPPQPLEEHIAIAPDADDVEGYLFRDGTSNLMIVLHDLLHSCCKRN